LESPVRQVLPRAAKTKALAVLSEPDDGSGKRKSNPSITKKNQARMSENICNGIVRAIHDLPDVKTRRYPGKKRVFKLIRNYRFYEDNRVLFELYRVALKVLLSWE
jgi:hypothetical protein